MPELNVTAPEGSHFEFEEVSTAKGTQSLGNVPILVWDSLDGAVGYYGEQGVIDVLDGTSLRTSYQGIARRLKIAGKTDEEIATAIVAFKPGRRAGGASTPASRARKAADSASEKVNGDALAKLLERIAAGEVTVNEDGSIQG